MKIRPAEQKDRERIHEILRTTGRFSDEEVRCAMELVDEWLTRPEKGDYIVHVVEPSKPPLAVTGYVCYGPTPLTDGVYDLYWIAVDPRHQGEGYGQQLLQFVEGEVRRGEGRMLLIETSSKDSYGPTLRFYERSGYEEISRIKDFYRIEDDKLVFCKRLTP
ncbi:MAG TPA: N-acetyltransferase [Thermoanaerobaculia bacterium]|nr:N-acetyltransferase [Thermoanaerobaculia bacterium]